MVRDIRDAGKTVILVSHVVDEAEAPHDRIAVIALFKRGDLTLDEVATSGVHRGR